MTSRRVHWGDHVASFLTPRRRLFGRGWGDADRLARLATIVRFEVAPPPIEVRWTGLSRRENGLFVRDGVFPSPVDELPLVAREAHIRWLGTTDPDHAHGTPVYVVLAASGDVGYATRTRLWDALIRSGEISVVLLENPLYGSRRPSDQHGTDVSTVCDHLAMNVGMVEEARALLGWLRDRGFAHRGVSGFSMGASMAALCSAVCREPIATALFSSGISAVPIFTEGLLSRSIDFETLSHETGSVESARARLGALFAAADLHRHPVPARPDAAVIISGRRDGYVFPETVASLHAHWLGSELRWLDTGHAGALVLNGESLRAAARDAMKRLRARA